MTEKGKIELNKVISVRACKSNEFDYENCIELETKDRNWILSHETSKDRDIWVDEIKKIMKQYEKRFVSSHCGYLWRYDKWRDKQFKKWHKYFFALNETETENRLCCFGSEGSFNELQQKTMYGEVEFDTICKRM